MKKEREGLFAYNDVIYRAYLSKTQHTLLAYYAVAYNWTNGEASYHSQEQICRILHMSPGTYQSTRDELESLGWISIEKKFLPNADKKSVFVTVHCGRDDGKRAAKIATERQNKALKKLELLEDAEAFDFMGGRNPTEQKKYEQAIFHFENKHPDLSRKPKFKNSAIPSGSQSKRIQFDRENR